MQKRLIIDILVGLLIGSILLIGILFNKKNKDVPETQIETQITSETTTSSTTTTTTTKTTKTTSKTTYRTTTKKVEQTSSGYKLTHYGPDCSGCSGTTASGYNVKNTIYYNDTSYGKLRVVAMCSKYPFYSIIKIKNYKLGGDTLAIVLDRGVGCSTIDLLVESEKKSSQLGIQNNVQIEILRRGN